MARWQLAQNLGKQLVEGDGSAACIPGVASPSSEIVASGQGVGMVRSQHPQMVRE